MKSFLSLEKRRNLVIKYAPTLSRLIQPDLFSHLERLCLFIGHGRSGSTLVGAILNAHPNVVMSNELDVIDHLRQDINQCQLLNLIYFEARRHSRRGSPGGGGYTYEVPNQWQGKHREIRVIGDRKAGSTAIQLFREPHLRDRLRDIVCLPSVFLCVVRNPFDTITTTFQKTPRLEGESADGHLQRQIDRYFDRWAAITVTYESVGSEAFRFIYHEDLVDDPSSSIRQLCEFLQISSDAGFVSDCASIIRHNPHLTRHSIDWNSQSIDIVDERKSSIPWLENYTY